MLTLNFICACIVFSILIAVACVKCYMYGYRECWYDVNRSAVRLGLLSKAQQKEYQQKKEAAMERRAKGISVLGD